MISGNKFFLSYKQSKSCKGLCVLYLLIISCLKDSNRKIAFSTIINCSILASNIQQHYTNIHTSI